MPTFIQKHVPVPRRVDRSAGRVVALALAVGGEGGGGVDVSGLHSLTRQNFWPGFAFDRHFPIGFPFLEFRTAHLAHVVSLRRDTASFGIYIHDFQNGPIFHTRRSLTGFKVPTMVTLRPDVVHVIGDVMKLAPQSYTP